MRRRRVIASETEPALHRFERDPPDDTACLERLHAAFSGYRSNWNWCRQCFSLEEEAAVRAAGDPRRASLDSFGRIYFEHPDCSGGSDTFLHWLPRGLELAFLDCRHDYLPMEGAMKLGLWRWPREEQEALRALFCRVALNWFAGGEPAPLRLSRSKVGRGHDAYVSGSIVEVLLMLRIDPFDLFAWLSRLDAVRTRDVLVDLATRDRLVDTLTYYVLEDKADEPVQRAGLDALDRLARDALGRVAGEARLVRLWAWAEDADPALACEIAETEWLRVSRGLRLVPTARLADRSLVATASG